MLYLGENSHFHKNWISRHFWTTSQIVKRYLRNPMSNLTAHNRVYTNFAGIIFKYTLESFEKLPEVKS